MNNEWNNTATVEPLPMTESQLDEIRAAIRDSLKKTEKGGSANTLQNCVVIMENDPLLKGAVRRNLLTGCVDIFGKMPWHRETTRLTDRDFPFIMLIFDKYYGISLERNIRNALEISANRNGYHPIRSYLQSLRWDGMPRVKEALHHFLGAERNGYNEEFLHIFMLGAVKRVFHPGTKFELMLNLIGGQGAGKSTFLRFLAVRDEWFSDDLKRLEDENVFRKLQGKWIIELSEMVATANARSTEDIKSFVSRCSDTYKVPYDRYPEDHDRQCVFAGTSNRMDFLPMDRSGNRRFLPVEVHPDRAEVHILDNEAESRAYIDQMWAEIMAEVDTGECKTWLTKEEERRLIVAQENFVQEDTTAGQIYGFMDTCPYNQVCTRLLYRESLGHQYDEPKQWEIREIRDIVNSGIATGVLKGWRQYKNSRRYEKYGTQRGWERIPPPEQISLEIPSGYVLLKDEEIPPDFPWKNTHTKDS